MKALKLALKKQPVVYIARDLERALGLSKGYNDYYIITNSSSLAKSLVKHKSVIALSADRLLDTHELLIHSRSKEIIKKLKNPLILVFKNTPLIEKNCQEHGWKLLNPPTVLSNKIEEKISQVEWLEELRKLLPPHQVTTCKNVQFKRKKFILQFNRAHTGSGTILIESEEQLKKLQQKFPNRPVRITEFIEGPMFTNNNIVWGKKILCGNINYQITGLEPFTDRPFATIGNDWALPHKLLHEKLQNDYFKIAEAVGKKLARDGWKGLFGVDVILDQKKKKLYLIEINARQPASTTFESQLQNSQLATQSSQLVTIFEAHLASLLGLKYNKEELIKIKDGGQIIQRVTEKIKYQKYNIKNIIKKLENFKCNIITYKNRETGEDLIRIQSKKNFMEDHATLNKFGQQIKNTLQ